MRYCNRTLSLLSVLAAASFGVLTSDAASTSRRIETKGEGCVAQAVAWLPEDPKNVPESFRHLTFQCELDPVDANGEIGRMVELQLTMEQEEELKNLMGSGAFIPNSSILAYKSTSNVFGTSIDVEVFDDSVRVPPGVAISSLLKKGTRPDNRQRNRRLGDAFGESATLVIRAIDTRNKAVPQSVEDLSKFVFGPESEDPINARNQFVACSAGQFDLAPAQFGSGDTFAAPGVVEVNMDVSLVGNSQETIRSSILRAANQKLQYNLPGDYEFTLYAIEDCHDGCGWAAYAYYNSHLSVYRKNYASYPAVVLHELGHNFGLGHSGEVSTYDDHSCLMGNPLFDFNLGKMCYNAAKSWQVGWYSDAEVDFRPVTTSNPSSWTGQLVGVAQYSYADRGNRPVTVRVDSGGSVDYFINFNRKIGMNSQNRQGSDLVNVYEQAGNGESTGSASKVLQRMGVGDEWTKTNFGNSGKTLSIKVNNIVLGDESNIGYADVDICLGFCSLYPTISPFPSEVPSISWSERPSLISPSPSGNPTFSVSPTMESDYEDYSFSVGASNGQNSKQVELPFDNMLAFPQPINKNQFYSFDSFSAEVQGKTLTVTKLNGGSWSQDFICRLVRVADSSSWEIFTVGPSEGKGSNPYTVVLPEENMRVIPYPKNSMQAWYNDTFEVEVTGNKLKVTRIDRDQTWGMNLKLYIASSTASPTISTTNSPSLSPTSSPTTSPIQPPSLSPTNSPSAFPSSSPTNSPSAFPSSSTNNSPSASPGEVCSEEPTDLFHYKANGKESSKMCSWLNKNTTTNKQKRKACKIETSSSDGLAPASVVCRESCGTCPQGPSSAPSTSPSISSSPSFQGGCSQNGSTSFIFLVNNNGTKWRTCNDLALMNKTKIKNACKRDYGDDGYGKEAKYMCRVTCNTCPSDCEVRVEELQKTNDYLQKRVNDLEKAMQELV